MSAGLSGLIRKVKTFLGIKPKPARISVPVQAPPAGARILRILPQDIVPIIATGAIVLGGCGLTLAAIIAGRRRSRGRFAAR